MATLIVSPLFLDFVYFLTSPDLPAEQTVSISDSELGVMGWVVTVSESWMSVSVASGTAPFSPAISVDITGLPAGTYTGHVVVTAVGATGSPIEVDVTLSVNEAGSTGDTTPLSAMASAIPITPLEGLFSVVPGDPETGYMEYTQFLASVNNVTGGGDYYEYRFNTDVTKDVWSVWSRTPKYSFYSTEVGSFTACVQIRDEFGSLTDFPAPSFLRGDYVVIEADPDAAFLEQAYLRVLQTLLDDFTPEIRKQYQDSYLFKSFVEALATVIAEAQIRIKEAVEQLNIQKAATIFLDLWSDVLGLKRKLITIYGETREETDTEYRNRIIDSVFWDKVSNLAIKKSLMFKFGREFTVTDSGTSRDRFTFETIKKVFDPSSIVVKTLDFGPNLFDVLGSSNPVWSKSYFDPANGELLKTYIVKARDLLVPEGDLPSISDIYQLSVHKYAPGLNAENPETIGYSSFFFPGTTTPKELNTSNDTGIIGTIYKNSNTPNILTWYGLVNSLELAKYGSYIRNQTVVAHKVVIDTSVSPEIVTSFTSNLLKNSNSDFGLTNATPLWPYTPYGAGGTTVDCPRGLVIDADYAYVLDGRNPTIANIRKYSRILVSSYREDPPGGGVTRVSTGWGPVVTEVIIPNKYATSMCSDGTYLYVMTLGPIYGRRVYRYKKVDLSFVDETNVSLMLIGGPTEWTNWTMIYAEIHIGCDQNYVYFSDRQRRKVHRCSIGPEGSGLSYVDAVVSSPTRVPMCVTANSTHIYSMEYSMANPYPAPNQMLLYKYDSSTLAPVGAPVDLGDYLTPAYGDYSPSMNMFSLQGVLATDDDVFVSIQSKQEIYRYKTSDMSLQYTYRTRNWTGLKHEDYSQAGISAGAACLAMDPTEALLYYYDGCTGTWPGYWGILTNNVYLTSGVGGRVPSYYFYTDSTLDYCLKDENVANTSYLMMCDSFSGMYLRVNLGVNDANFTNPTFEELDFGDGDRSIYNTRSLTMSPTSPKMSSVYNYKNDCIYSIGGGEFDVLGGADTNYYKRSSRWNVLKSVSGAIGSITRVKTTDTASVSTQNNFMINLVESLSQSNVFNNPNFEYAATNPGDNWFPSGAGILPVDLSYSGADFTDMQYVYQTVSLKRGSQYQVTVAGYPITPNNSNPDSFWVKVGTGANYPYNENVAPVGYLGVFTVPTGVGLTTELVVTIGFWGDASSAWLSSAAMRETTSIFPHRTMFDLSEIDLQYDGNEHIFSMFLGGRIVLETGSTSYDVYKNIYKFTLNNPLVANPLSGGTWKQEQNVHVDILPRGAGVVAGRSAGTYYLYGRSTGSQIVFEISPYKDSIYVVAYGRTADNKKFTFQYVSAANSSYSIVPVGSGSAKAKLLSNRYSISIDGASMTNEEMDLVYKEAITMTSIGNVIMSISQNVNTIFVDSLTYGPIYYGVFTPGGSPNTVVGATVWTPKGTTPETYEDGTLQDPTKVSVIVDNRTDMAQSRRFDGNIYSPDDIIYIIRTA